MDNSSKEPIKKTTKKRVGRPSKKEVITKKPGNRNLVGRPKGDAAIMNDYKARMLASPKSRKVLTKILDAALDDDHKHQAAAWKLVIDRILPVSQFDKEAAQSGKHSVNITITGLQSTVKTTESTEVEEETIDGEYEEIE